MATRINVGSGSNLKQDWINIDQLDIVDPNYMKWDLRKGLPPQINNVSQISLSHVNEHLSIEDNIKLMRDCFTKLVPGGSLFIELPDFVSVIKAYLVKDWTYFHHPAIMHFCRGFNIASLLDYALHQRVDGVPEHITFLDAEYMEYILHEAGFKTVHHTKYCPGISNPDPLRIKYSIYLEAIK